MSEQTMMELVSDDDLRIICAAHVEAADLASLSDEALCALRLECIKAVREHKGIGGCRDDLYMGQVGRRFHAAVIAVLDEMQPRERAGRIPWDFGMERVE